MFAMAINPDEARNHIPSIGSEKAKQANHSNDSCIVVRVVASSPNFEGKEWMPCYDTFNIHSCIIDVKGRNPKRYPVKLQMVGAHSDASVIAAVHAYLAMATKHQPGKSRLRPSQK